MAQKLLWSFFLSAMFCLTLTKPFAIAQARPESDARFEKLAKEFYPKAKQEGALVVYTVWDVDHIRSLTEAFSKRFPGINTSYWQATRSEVTTRTLTEYQGNQAGVDVIHTEAPLVLHNSRRNASLSNRAGQFLVRQRRYRSGGQPADSSARLQYQETEARRGAEELGGSDQSKIQRDRGVGQSHESRPAKFHAGGV